MKFDKPGQPRPYVARVWRGGKRMHLGSFATAEEAAMCVARSPEGQAAAKRSAAAPPLVSEEARRQAEAAGRCGRLAPPGTRAPARRVKRAAGVTPDTSAHEGHESVAVACAAVRRCGACRCRRVRYKKRRLCLLT